MYERVRPLLTSVPTRPNSSPDENHSYCFEHGAVRQNDRGTSPSTISEK